MYIVRRNCVVCGCVWTYWNNAPEGCPECARALLRIKKANPPYRCSAVKDVMMARERFSESTDLCQGTMQVFESSGALGFPRVEVLQCDACHRTALPEGVNGPIEPA